MHLSSLEMRGFRRFSKATIELDSRLNLLVGENGAGKTTVLHAVRLLLGQALYLSLGGPKSIRIRIPRLTSDDFRRSIQTTPGGQRTLTRATRCSLKGAICCGEKTVEVEFTRPAAAARKAPPAAPLDTASGRPLPVFAYYSAHRGNPRKSPSISPRAAISVLPGHYGAHFSALGADTSFEQFVNWFKSEEETELRDIRENLQTSRSLAAVRRAFETVFSGSATRYTNPRYLPRGVGLAFTQTAPDGTETIVPFGQLADGYKSIITIVGDYARRLALANPLGDPLEGEGVLLIDEIDLHLHPGWQQRVVGDLQRTFPNVQIIATTHAPEVIASVPRENVFVFSADPENPSCVELKHPDFQTSGMGSEDVLPHVMNVDSQPPQTEAAKALKKYYALLQSHEAQEPSPHLRELRVWLEKHFGANHPKMYEILKMENRQRIRRRLEQLKGRNPQ